MVRYTIKDQDKTISFLEDQELAPRLVAACAADPNLLEDLLMATEPFQPGVVAGVTRALLRYDSALRTQATLPLFAAFEVADRASSVMAEQPDRDGLLVIDLPARTILNRLPENVDLTSRGSVRARLPGTDLERETVYALNQDWKILRPEATAAVPAEKRQHA